MSEVNQSSDEDTTEEYRLPGSYQEKYGMAQQQLSVRPWISISWSGSAYELIRDDLAEEFEETNPRGVGLRAFARIKTGIRIHTFPEAKAVWNQITDELHRRRINQRQRNSLHRVRDKIEDAFEDMKADLKGSARRHYNGEREGGKVPRPDYDSEDIRLDAPVTDEDFIQGRVAYHVGPGPSIRPSVSSYWDDRDREAEIEEVVAELPLMYGYDD